MDFQHRDGRRLVGWLVHARAPIDVHGNAFGWRRNHVFSRNFHGAEEMTGTIWLLVAALGAVLFVYACVSADKRNPHNGRSFTRRVDPVGSPHLRELRRDRPVEPERVAKRYRKAG